MSHQATTECSECDRIFDLRNEVDAEEWFYGHDCEERSCACGEYAESGLCADC